VVDHLKLAFGVFGSLNGSLEFSLEILILQGECSRTISLMLERVGEQFVCFIGLLADTLVVLLQLGDLLRTLVAEVPLSHAILDSASILGIFLWQRLATRLRPGRHLCLSAAWSQVGSGRESSGRRGLRLSVDGYRVLGRAAAAAVMSATTGLGHAVRLARLAEAGRTRVLLQGGVGVLRVAKIAVVGGSQRD